MIFSLYYGNQIQEKQTLLNKLNILLLNLYEGTMMHLFFSLSFPSCCFPFFLFSLPFFSFVLSSPFFGSLNIEHLYRTCNITSLSSVTFIKSANQCSFKLCLIVQLVAVWTLMYITSLIADIEQKLYGVSLSLLFIPLNDEVAQFQSATETSNSFKGVICVIKSTLHLY